MCKLKAESLPCLIGASMYVDNHNVRGEAKGTYMEVRFLHFIQSGKISILNKPYKIKHAYCNP